MEKVKMTNRKIKALETRSKIFETADRLFRQYGFENVSIDSIVEAAGLSKGAFYVHFDSKDALTAELFSSYANELDLDYKSYLDTFPTDTAASTIIISLAGKIADTITDLVGYDNIRTLYKVQIIRSVNTEAILGHSRELYKIFSDLMIKGKEQGEFAAELPVDTFANHFIMALRGLTYEWCIRYPEFKLKEQVQEHIQIMLTGIKK